MKKDAVKLKKGGLDTIIAYIVVMLPLLYVLIYMVATIYHFSVQMYMNQVVKEAAVMASTYGEVTDKHEQYIKEKLKDVLGEDKNGTKCSIEYYVRSFDEKNGIVGEISGPSLSRPYVEKADILGIRVQSTEDSLMETVTTFNIFNTNPTTTGLKYTSYREEIIRNERKYNP